MHNGIFKFKLDSYLLLAIVLIPLAVFSPVAWHGFINFDDDVFVYANPNIQAGLTFASIRWAFTTAYEVNWIPLTWISHMLDIQMFGLNPAGHHIVNLLFHTANCAVLYMFLKRATGAPWRSAAAAIMFAVHPQHVESVAWVAERKDVLSTFFGLLTLYAYTRYSENPGFSRYAVTLFLFLLGLLSKPMLVTLPVILLLLDWWPLGRTARAEGDFSSRHTGYSRLIAEKIPFFILSACSSIITYLVQQGEGELVQGYTLFSRAGKAAIAYIAYLQKMVWPAKLAVLYPFSKYPPSSAEILLSAVMLALVTVAVILLRKRGPYLVTGWGWYIVTLLPVIGLIQIGQHSMADRYTYVPLIGIFIVLSWGIPQLLDGWKSRGVILSGLLAASLVAMIIVTSMQLRYWKDGLTIFTHTVEVTENNWVAQNNLGYLYLGEGKIDDAIWHFKESLKAKPSYVLALLNLGVAHRTRNEYKEAAESFKWALQFAPLNPQAHYSLGCIDLIQGDKKRAMEEYQVLQRIGSPFAPVLMEMINASIGTKMPLTQRK
jgi:tetratricopeptide (TPR) repeat protein